MAETFNYGPGASQTGIPRVHILHLQTISPLASSFVFAVMNTSPKNQTVDVSMFDVFYDQGKSFAQRTFILYDLWQKDSDGKWGAVFGEVTGNMTLNVPTHGVKVFRAFPSPTSSSSKRSTTEL